MEPNPSEQESNECLLDSLRFFQIITGGSALTPQEQTWLTQHPEWADHVQEVTATWKLVEAQSPQAAKFLKQEFQKLSPDQNLSPGR